MRYTNRLLTINQKQKNNDKKYTLIGATKDDEALVKLIYPDAYVYHKRNAGFSVLSENAGKIKALAYELESLKDPNLKARCRNWIEDYVDQETGQVISLERKDIEAITLTFQS